MEQRALLSASVDLNGNQQGVDNVVIWSYTDAVPIWLAPNATLTDTNRLTLTFNGPHDNDRFSFFVPSGYVLSGNTATSVTVSGPNTGDLQQVLRSVEIVVPYYSVARRTDSVTVRADYYSSDVLISSNTANATIDILPVVWITDSAGDSSQPVQFSVHLTGASWDTISVNYSTADDATQTVPAVAGQDYVPASGTVTFQPGETLKMIDVAALPHPRSFEAYPDKVFQVNLSGATNAGLASYAANFYPPFPSRAQGTIYDDILTNPNPDSGGPGFDDSYIDAPQEVPALTRSSLFSVKTGVLTLDQHFISGPLSSESSATYNSGALSPYYSSRVRVDRDMLYVPSGATLPDFVGGATLPYPHDPALDSQPGYPLLSTGTYVWGATAGALKYHGRQSVVNRIDSPYGAGWWISSLDQLFIQDALQSGYSGTTARIKPKGITDVLGDGTAIFFAYDSETSSYKPPHGYFLTLTQNTDGFLVENPQGQKKQFTRDDAHTARLIWVEEANGNRTNYSYNADYTLASISDTWGHTALYGYTNGKLSSVTDAAGRRTTIDVVQRTAGEV